MEVEGSGMKESTNEGESPKALLISEILIRRDADANQMRSTQQLIGGCKEADDFTLFRTERGLME